MNTCFVFGTVHFRPSKATTTTTAAAVEAPKIREVEERIRVLQISISTLVVLLVSPKAFRNEFGRRKRENEWARVKGNEVVTVSNLKAESGFLAEKYTKRQKSTHLEAPETLFICG